MQRRPVWQSVWFISGLILTITLVSAGSFYWRTDRTPVTRLLAEGIDGIEHNDLEVARRALEAIQGDARWTPYQPLLAGAVFLAENDPQASLNELRLLEPSESTRRPALYLVGQALYALSKSSEAFAVFQQLVNEYPDHIEARFWISRYWHDRGAVREAMDELSRITSLAPDDYRAFHRLGGFCCDFNRSNEAITFLDQALERHPPSAIREEILFDLGRSHFGLRHYADAVAALELAEPTAAGEAIRAESLEALGRNSESAAALARAQAIDSGDRSVLLLVARQAFQNGTPDVVRAPITAFLELHPADRELRHYLAQIHEAAGDHAAAESERARLTQFERWYNEFVELTRIAANDPADAESRERLAEICENLGEKGKARQWRLAATLCRQASQNAQPSPVGP